MIPASSKQDLIKHHIDSITHSHERSATADAIVMAAIEAGEDCETCQREELRKSVEIVTRELAYRTTALQCIAELGGSQ
jgi:tellurite resistance protein